MNVTEAEQLAADAEAVARYAQDVVDGHGRHIADAVDARWYAEEMNVPDWAVPAVVTYIANAMGF